MTRYVMLCSNVYGIIAEMPCSIVLLNPLTRRFQKKCLPENANSFYIKVFCYML